MRTAACAILFLMITCQGEALRCNYCFGKGTTLCTPTSVQTCSPLNNACGAVILGSPLSSSFRQCMNLAVCQGFIKTPGAYAICCTTDLCN